MNDNGRSSDLPGSMPANVNVVFEGMLDGDNEETLREIANVLAGHMRVISEHIDISMLDRVTIATDYATAVANVDRGIEVSDHTNQPTNDGIAIGVAMTISVLRDGVAKSHIVFAHEAVRAIADPNADEAYRLALYMVAHECAHVEGQHKFNTAFPNLILRPAPESWDSLDHNKWKYAIQLAFDEYAASRVSAPFGRSSQLSAYIDTFEETFKRSSLATKEILRAWVIDRDFEKVFHGMFQVYGNLMVRSAYVMGTMDGMGQ
ncbi:MAG: hypothetical protein OXH68_17135, partial [Gammaproteobacteria bacterium]|nr:hypothetical protein [Gammaproteobacteria bacterium]